MITKANYYKEVGKYGVKNLPKDMQEMHDLMNELTQNGSDWSVYDSDKDIQSYAQTQFDELTKVIENGSCYDKGRKVRIQPKSENSKLFIVWDLKSNQIFANEYFKSIEAAKHFVNLNQMDLVEIIDKKQKKAAKKEKYTGHKIDKDGKVTYNKKPKFNIGDKICWWDNDDSAMREEIKSIEHTSEGHPIYVVYSQKGGSFRYEEKYIQEKIRAKLISINTMPPKHIDNIPKEITFIKRYVRYNGKEVDIMDMRRFLKSIQLSITKGEIRKESMYADFIMEIQNNLVRAINTMFRNNQSSVIVEIAPEKLKVLNEIKSSKIVSKSTRLIKRFLTWLNDMTDLGKAEKLHGEIAKHLQDGHADHADELKKIESALKAHISGKEGIYVKFSEMELHGFADLAGLNGLGFVSQMLATGAGIVVGRQVSNYIDQKREDKEEKKVNTKIMSSTDISKSDFETLPFTGDWKVLIGEPSPGFSCLMFGVPKSGKSTLAIQFAKYLAKNFGETLYVAAEEGIHATLSDKIKRLDAVHERLKFAASIPGSVSEYSFVFIDSINRSKLSHADIVQFMTKNPKTAFIFISQVTKDGKYRGSQEIEHDVDCVIEVDEDGIAYGKGRFSQGGQVTINFGN